MEKSLPHYPHPVNQAKNLPMALIFRRAHPAENKIQAVYLLLSVAKKCL
jgi:hypothetical protein